MKPRTVALTAATILLALAAPRCTAQEQPPIRAAVFDVRRLEGPADADLDQMLTDTVRLEIANAGYALATGWEKSLAKGEPAPVRGPHAAEIARAVNASIAITAYYTRPDAGTVALSVQCWDAAGETLVASFTLSAPFDLSYYNLLHDRLEALASAAEKFTGPPRIEAIEVAAARGLGTITFHGKQDGVEVVLAGEKNLGTIEGGKLEAPVGMLAGGSQLELELRKPGFHTLATTVTAFGDTWLPELIPAHRFSADLGWNTGQPIGVGGAFNVFLVPDWVFLGAATELSAQVPSLGASGEHVVLHFDAGARVGSYLLPVKPQLKIFGATLELPFRLGVVAGIGALPSVSIATGHAAWLDWYILMPSPFLEIGTGHTVITFRTDQRYSLGLPGGALDRGWIMREVPDSKESDGTREVLPVQLGVTFKW